MSAHAADQPRSTTIPSARRSRLHQSRRLRRLPVPILLGLMLMLALLPTTPAQADDQVLPAFPGAEGFGMATTGGRGGEVYHITSRELTGAGTLHDALTTAGSEPRTIVFDIGGQIPIPQIIVRNKSGITIAGQTAPGDGVTIAGNNIRFYDSSQIIIRHLRFRMTDEVNDDTMYFEDCQDVIVDHSSFSWGSDEVLSVKSKDYDNPRSKNISVQWSIIAEGLLTHSMGGLVEMNTISMHHNLYAHNNDRNPKTKGVMDFVNNVVYNWGGFGYVAGGESGTKGYGNVVGNYFVAGANSTEPQYGVFRGNENYQVYLDDNRLDSDLDGRLDGIDPGTDIMEADRPSVPVDERFAYPPVHTQSPETAYEDVLDHAGASLNRDSVDRRVTTGVRHQTGVIIDTEGDVGGSGELDPGTAPTDSDADGMPDDWETARGLDPDDAADRNGDDNGNGYTNLEEYLNELAAPGFPAGYPLTPVDWDGDVFEPPTPPVEDTGPVEPLNGEVVRGVTINDTSANGTENAAHWSVRSDLQVGDVTHGDRDYRFTDIPAELLGSEWISTAVESRGADNEDVVSFHLARDTDIYLGYDSRISSEPDWLSTDYEDTGAVVTDDQPVTYRLFRRHVSAGTRVVLGPNSGGSTMNYFVVLDPTAVDATPGTPAAPTGEIADGSATLQWDPVEGATGYVVYRSSVADPYLRWIATTTDTRLEDPELTAGMPYTYRVAAVAPGGESEQSDELQLAFHDDAEQPPAAPEQPDATPHSYSVELTWAAVDGAIGYALQRAEEGGDFTDLAGTAESAFTDATAEPSTSYRYRLTALGAGGASEPSTAVEVTTERPLEQPTTPKTPTVEEIDHGSVSLSWPAITDAETYLVQRKADGDGGFTEIGSSTTPDYVDDTVSASATGHSYRVVATNERGSSEPSDEVHAVTPLPEAPPELKVGLAGEDFVGLIWKPGPGAADHAIYRSSKGKPAEKIGNENVSTFYDRTAEPGQEYTYTVRAVNGAGESEPSKQVTVRTYAAGLTAELEPWSRGQAYDEGDLVSHRGHTWVAGRDPGHRRPSPAGGPWLEAGELITGELGPQRAWTRTWVYRGGEIVDHDGSWWQARRPTQGRQPGSGHGPWRKVSP